MRRVGNARGWHHTPKARAKISAALRHPGHENRGRFVKGFTPWNTGRPHSTETRSRLSAASRLRWQDPAEHAKIAAANRRLTLRGPQDPRPCEVCGGRQIRGRRLDRDHDHLTGKPRGDLCKTCNIHLGNLELALRGLKGKMNYISDERWQFAALRYLKRHGSHPFEGKGR